MITENMQTSSSTSSMKILAQGSGSLTVPALAGAGQVQGTSVIPHGYGSDLLLFQVVVKMTGVYDMAPWNANSNNVGIWASIDENNLTVYGESNSGAAPVAARTVEYYYRIFIP